MSVSVTSKLLMLNRISWVFPTTNNAEVIVSYIIVPTSLWCKSVNYNKKSADSFF